MDETETPATTDAVPICGHHGNPLTWIDDDVRWRCPDCFPEFFPADPAKQSTWVTKAQLLRIQEGLLAVSNYAVSVRMGITDLTDEAAWRKQVDPFLVSNAILRDLMLAAEKRQLGEDSAPPQPT